MAKLFSCFFLVPLLWMQTVYGQYTDSSATGRRAASDTAFTGRNRSVKRGFSYKTAVLPAAMIVYGVASLNSDGLRDVNEHVKEEIWNEHTHRQVHADNYLQWAPAVAVYGLNLAGIKGKHDFKERTLIYGTSTIIMSGVVLSVKKISKEMRPDGSDLYSFPSGHTATAFAAAEFMRREYSDVSPWYAVGGYAAAAATGYLRMYNNKHWLGDVVAGAGVGILSTDLAYLIYPSLEKIFSGKHPSSTIVLPVYQHGTVGLGLVKVL